MNKYAEEILKKQCEIVGADYNSIDFNEDRWFMKHEWNKHTESEFCDWLSNYLHNNREARNTIMNHPTRRKIQRDATSKAWCFQYGWKYSI